MHKHTNVQTNTNRMPHGTKKQRHIPFLGWLHSQNDIRTPPWAVNKLSKSSNHVPCPTMVLCSCLDRTIVARVSATSVADRAVQCHTFESWRYSTKTRFLRALVANSPNSWLVYLQCTRSFRFWPWSCGQASIDDDCWTDVTMMMMRMTVMMSDVVVDVDVGAVESLHCLLLSLFGRRAHNWEREWWRFIWVLVSIN